MVGHLIEFLIDTGATFLVLKQRIRNLSSHKDYVMEVSGKMQGHTLVQDQWPVVFMFLIVHASLSNHFNGKKYVN